MKLPRQFFAPLAIGAPAPLRELPLRLERMVHFVPPHNEKVRAKVPELVQQVDVVLGNLEDAIPVEAKQAARHGFIEMAKAVDFKLTGLWTRINALNSPWALDDITEIVGSSAANDVSCCRKSMAMGYPFSRSTAGAARARHTLKADPDPRHSRNSAGRQ